VAFRLGGRVTAVHPPQRDPVDSHTGASRSDANPPRPAATCGRPVISVLAWLVNDVLLAGVLPLSVGGDAVTGLVVGSVSIVGASLGVHGLGAVSMRTPGWRATVGCRGGPGFLDEAHKNGVLPADGITYDFATPSFAGALRQPTGKPRIVSDPNRSTMIIDRNVEFELYPALPVSH